MPDGPGLAIVTGAARGIGAEVGLGLATERWSLLLVDACVSQPGVEYAMPAPADLERVAERCVSVGAPAAAFRARRA